MELLLLGMLKTFAFPPWESEVGTISLVREKVEKLLVVDIEFTDLEH